MRNLIFALAAVALSLFFGAACSSSASGRLPAMRALPVDSEARIASGEAVYVRYLGTGGVLIRWGDRTILTAPYFSGHSLGEIIQTSSLCAFAWQMKPKHAEIHKNADPFSANGGVADDLPDQLLKAEAIFVGHAHYDHLLDIPQIARCYAPNARVYGSTAAVSMLNQVAMDVRTQGRPPCPVRTGARPRTALNGPSNSFLLQFGDVELTPTGTVPIGNGTSGGEFEIRYRAVRHEHAPHVPHVDMLKLCRYAGQLGITHSPPKSACDWIEGQTFAYFFDLIRNDELIFRIYYNDAAGGADFARLPPGVAPGSVNLAVLTAASFQFVEDYPAAFLKTARPEIVLMNHWEDFFRFNQVRNASTARAEPPPGVLFTDLEEFYDIARETLRANGRPVQRVIMPDIGAEFLFDPET